MLHHLRDLSDWSRDPTQATVGLRFTESVHKPTASQGCSNTTLHPHRGPLLRLGAFQSAEHGIRVSPDLVGHGPLRGAATVSADEFSGEVGGESFNPFQTFGLWDWT